MRVLVTRPADDGVATAERLRALGHEPLLAPLLTTHFLDRPVPALADVQAILATSANGVRAFARLSAERDLPLFAVGPQTAAAASAAGFRAVRNAQGDAAALARATADLARPETGALLHVCGEESSGLLMKDLSERGFEVRRALLYRVDAAPSLPAAAASALALGTLDAALFFSPRSARVFAQLAKDHDIRRMIAVCISRAAAAALAPLSFAEFRIAARPDQCSLLACLAGRGAREST
jgi:uroporphyrinogen-III synthase